MRVLNCLFKMLLILFVFVFLRPGTAFSQTLNDKINSKTVNDSSVRVGASRTGEYFPLLSNKNIAVVANHTSMIGKTHLVDSLVNAGFNVKKIFCPEHGFRGNKDAGESVISAIDSATGIPVVSLFGKHFKPKPSELKGIDIVIYDIQDVGVRFYTYISTMTYVMEACAENNVEFLILDRPNPNGYFIDGPVLKKEFSSFVGMHPVPLVYGMTVAEYATMVNGEGWLKNGIKCTLKYVAVEGYNHTYYYELPLKPSPNLPNMNSVYLYPSLGLFEGTVISVGRGTDFPFQCFGHPDLTNGTYSFTPKSVAGALNPPFLGKECKGFLLDNFAEAYIRNLNQIYLYWLIESYNQIKGKTTFFNSYFDTLAGNSELRLQIIAGKDEETIRKSWTDDINKFKKIRKKYLLYPDFE